MSVHKKHNLGLVLRPRSPEPVNFFGAQSSLGGAQFLFGGGTSSQLGGGAQAVSWAPGLVGSRKKLQKLALVITITILPTSRDSDTQLLAKNKLRKKN